MADCKISPFSPASIFGTALDSDPSRALVSDDHFNRNAMDDDVTLVDSADLGKKADIKILYGSKSVCSCCTNWVDRKPATDNPEKAIKAKKERDEFAVLHRKKQHSESGWKTHSIVINSPFLKDFLAGIFEDYRGVEARASELVFEPPFAPFFHRWNEIQEAKKAIPAEEAERCDHLSLLLGILEPELREAFHFEKILESTRLVTFAQLPLLYVPGEILINNQGPKSATVLGEVVFAPGLLLPSEVREVLDLFSMNPSISLSVMNVDWDGQRFGALTSTWKQPSYEGSLNVDSLTYIPLRLIRNNNEIENALIARGRTFSTLGERDWSLRNYKGTFRYKNMPTYSSLSKDIFQEWVSKCHN